MSTSTLKIEGMTCDGCATRVTKAIKGVDGVADVQVSLAEGTAHVTGDAALETPRLIAAVEKLGYRASGKA